MYNIIPTVLPVAEMLQPLSVTCMVTVLEPVPWTTPPPPTDSYIFSNMLSMSLGYCNAVQHFWDWSVLISKVS